VNGSKKKESKQERRERGRESVRNAGKVEDSVVPAANLTVTRRGPGKLYPSAFLWQASTS
jgi:hypothetical protein